MKTTIALTDIKNVMRDKSLWIIFMLPIMLIFILRTAPPLYEIYLPAAIEYRPLILGFFSLLTATMAGFLISFVLLDEKDQGMFPVFNITPLRFKGLIGYRIVNMIILGTAFSFVVNYFSGLIEISLIQAFALALVCSLAAPINALLIVALANNKIEGVTYYKLVNVIAMLPMIGMFLVAPFKYIFGIIPYLWVYLTLENLDSLKLSLFYLSIGLIMHVVYLVAAYRFLLMKHGN